MKVHPTSTSRTVTDSFATEPPHERSFREVLVASASRIAEGDRDLARLASLGASDTSLDSRSLLRLQATVYRTTHEIDLAGRLVDRLTQAVKTTLQSQG